MAIHQSFQRLLPFSFASLVFILPICKFLYILNRYFQQASSRLDYLWELEIFTRSKRSKIPWEIISQNNRYYKLKLELSESGNEQALYQFYGFLVTVAISLLSGTLTGLLMRLSIWDQIEPRKYFDDVENWEIEKLPVDDDETNLWIRILKAQ